MVARNSRELHGGLWGVGKIEDGAGLHLHDDIRGCVHLILDELFAHPHVLLDGLLSLVAARGRRRLALQSTTTLSLGVDHLPAERPRVGNQLLLKRSARPPRSTPVARKRVSRGVAGQHPWETLALHRGTRQPFLPDQGKGEGGARA